MISMASTSSSTSSASSNSAGGGKQIQPGFVDFQPYPTVRLHLWADQQEEMDLTFGGHRFLFGAEGSYHFLAPDFSGPSAKDHESPKPSAPFTNLTGERSPPPNYIKSIESGGARRDLRQDRLWIQPWLHRQHQPHAKKGGPRRS